MHSVMGEAFRKARREAMKKRRASRQLKQSEYSRLPDIDQSDAYPPPKVEHTWLYSMLNPHSKQPQAVVYKYVMAFLIITDTILFVVGTVESVKEKLGDWIYIHEGLMSCIFLVEYILRLVTITQSRKYRSPVLGRLNYIISFPALIDLASCLPFFIELIFAKDLPTLTFLRMFRLVRILKTESYAEACSSAGRVLRYNSEILVVAFLMCAMLLLLTSTILYYLRPKGELDSNDFMSIPDCMYLAILMLTGQGVPDGDLPWYTKLIVMATAVFSVAMFAIPASMLTWGFEAEAERMARVRYERRKRHKEYRAAYGRDPPPSDSSSSSLDGCDSSDEEYFRTIAGVDDEADEEKREKAQALKMFRMGDKDDSNGLSFEEFWSLHQHLNKSQGGGIGNKAAFGSAFTQDLKVRTDPSKHSESSVGVMGMVKKQEQTQELLSNITRELQRQRQQLDALAEKLDIIAGKLQ